MTTEPERGSMALEAAIIAPALAALLLMIIGLGRITLANGAIDAAARDAARQASIARDSAGARSAALASAHAALAREGLSCSPSVTVDTAGFSAPVGTRADVVAHVSCQVDLSDITLPGVPGSKRLTSSFTSPIDPFRARKE
ncbi:TadE/TadG family type IV pilus assembly protein [Spongiactinospora sp. TRM90649]|uniref:TadE/TadG family type IV pilus assembly protein n=1 Tax=Spongiactinospora sp. TRM90649 TaxID=3031114 RepID=UPI0023F7AC85|nr:TadE/TadG family type IV pilus assembly protein [Spongiactinospora sp. TRM90649]MDF5759052.1 TadE/TadG family type IV pilus assembly protein [Spongiactinospora sp. TRM90649]